VNISLIPRPSGINLRLAERQWSGRSREGSRARAKSFLELEKRSDDRMPPGIAATSEDHSGSSCEGLPCLYTLLGLPDNALTARRFNGSAGGTIAEERKEITSDNDCLRSSNSQPRRRLRFPGYKRNASYKNTFAGDVTGGPAPPLPRSPDPHPLPHSPGPRRFAIILAAARSPRILLLIIPRRGTSRRTKSRIRNGLQNVNNGWSGPEIMRGRGRAAGGLRACGEGARLNA
jgi:hypothetical protein